MLQHYSTLCNTMQAFIVACNNRISHISEHKTYTVTQFMSKLAYLNTCPTFKYSLVAITEALSVLQHCTTGGALEITQNCYKITFQYNLNKYYRP